MFKKSVQEIVESTSNSDFFQNSISPKKSSSQNIDQVVLSKYLEITNKEAKTGSWGINLSTQKTFLSKAACDILEISSNVELSLNDFLLLVHPDDVKQVMHEWERISKGEAIQTEFRIIINNKIKWIKGVSSNQWKDSNKEIQIVGCVQDITEINERQQELECKKMELDFIIKNVPVSVTQLSPDFKLIFSNYDYENSGGVDFFNHISPIYHESLRIKFIQAKQTGESVSLELKGFGKNLILNWYRLVINKVDKISNDYPYTYFVIGKDITYEKKFQEELIKASTESEEKERKRIAFELHDGVCQNLVALKMLALKFAKENPSVLESLQKSNTFYEIRSLIDATLSDIRRCSYDLMPIDIELEGLYGALKKLFAINNAATNIKHTLEINAISEPHNYIANNIYRIVQEFIQNSQKHSKGTELYLRISENKHHLIFRLADNGKGFPKSEDYKTGIGTLSMLARIKNIGGTYNVITNSNEGVQLYFSINIE